MTKHLRFLFVMLLAMIWSAGWAAVGDNFKLVTDAKDLKAGDKIIIGSKASNVVLGAPSTEKSDKRAAVSATFSSDGVVAWKEDFDVITLEGSASAWYLHSEAGYLYSELQKDGKASTNLKNAPDKSTAKVVLISISASGTAKISFKGIGSGRYIHYNGTVYGYYSQTTPSAQIYKLVNSSETKTATKVSFDENSGQTFTFTEGEYTNGTFTTPTATETTGVAGTVAYSSSNATAISVDASTGALTFNGYGKATITATFTPNDTEIYAGSTDSYIVENNQKVDESVIIFSADAKSFKSITDNYKDNNGNIDFIATNGKKYTFDVQKARNNNDKLQLNGSTLTSPSFPDFTNGYKVTIEYETLKATITLSSGSKSVKGSSKDKTILLDVQDGSAFKINITSNVLYISKIEIVPNKVGITLDENSESNTIEAKNGVNVTLKRTMVANEWNTICLPFDVSKEKAQTAFGEGVKIAQLDDKNSTGNTLKFVNMTDYGMEATVPYLIKPSKENTSNEYVFENVNVVADDINKKYESTEDYLVFKGIYNMMDIKKDVVDNVDATHYAAFLGDGNKIYKAGTGMTKGFRAYFAIPKGAAASALRVVIDGTATSIKNIDSEVVESNAPVYNLQGQRVNGNNLTPGIYVKAGKKFVVK